MNTLIDWMLEQIQHDGGARISSYWRMPVSSQNNYLLDAGIHQHDGKEPES